MKRLRFHLAALLLPALLACGGEEAPGRDLVDLRPVWEPGRVYEIRVERTIRKGDGEFPPKGELESRSTANETLLDLYTEEVLAASGTHLGRTVRTYLRSQRVEDGKESPTPLAGHAYEIEDPFGEHRAFRIGAEGERSPVDDEEMKLLKASSLLLAATLIPDQPVAEGASWRPGRELAGLSAVGSGRVGLGCRLAKIRDEAGVRTAEVTGAFGGRINEGGGPGAQLSAREVLQVNLTTREIRTYRSEMEIAFLPLSGSRKGSWRWSEATLTVRRQ